MTYRFDRAKFAWASRRFLAGAEQREGHSGEREESRLQHPCEDLGVEGLRQWQGQVRDTF